MADQPIEIKVEKNIEQEMIRLLEKGAQGLVLAFNYKGQSGFILNNGISDKQGFTQGLLELFKRYG